MKRWIMLALFCLSGQAEAVIYKCRDAGGHVLYQAIPCPGASLGQVEEMPPVPEADRQRAQKKLDRMIEQNRLAAASREQERQKQEELARRQAEQEALARQQAERERLEQENRERYFWSPWFQRFPWFQRHDQPHRQRHPSPQNGPPPQQRGMNR